MAIREFAARYPLVEGQGNFGNIDGDNPAAMRYTEARLTAVAEALLQGIDENAVDFRPNYDGSAHEPIVLPGAFPNLLANGAAGIAVGMATSIPPHNAGELCDALLHLIKTPNARIDTLVDLVKGPDFPTGGILVEPRDSIVESYKTGRGSFRLRARWNKEELARGQYRIVVTQIPYQVQKGKLIERIAEIINAKKLPILEDVRDESAEDVRIVLEPRTGQVPAELLMEQLFKMTDLEIRFPLNLNVLDKDNTQAGAAGLARSSAGCPGPPLDVPAGRDRATAGNSRRLPDRLSQPRQADQDHPRGGRAQAQDDQGLQALRPAGRGHPQHAAARVAPAGGIRDQG